MEIGLRILALVIDMGLCLGSLPLVLGGFGWILTNTGMVGVVLSPVFIAGSIVWPFLYFGLFTGLWGRTPGKFLLSLRVINALGEKPSLPRALGREALKLVAIASSIGAFICLLQVLYQHVAWYDYLCGTNVEYRKRVRLTATQKHFRKVYGQDRRTP